MSDLEDLAEIADMVRAPPPTPRLPSMTCYAGHPRTQENTRRYKRGKRISITCRICDKNRATLRRRCSGIAVRNAASMQPASEDK